MLLTPKEFSQICNEYEHSYEITCLVLHSKLFHTFFISLVKVDVTTKIRRIGLDLGMPFIWMNHLE